MDFFSASRRFGRDGGILRLRRDPILPRGRPLEDGPEDDGPLPHWHLAQERKVVRQSWSVVKEKNEKNKNLVKKLL